MKHPSKWENTIARRTVLVLATLFLFPIQLIAYLGMATVEGFNDWAHSFKKVWRRSNDS